jgi:hypothetical protein
MMDNATSIKFTISEALMGVQHPKSKSTESIEV